MRIRLTTPFRGKTEVEMDGTTNETMMTNPTRFLDSSDKTETVEVGVIVMGLCCICLVACALVVLQLRSNNRRITGNRQRSGNAGNGSGDRTGDPPPSYNAVIRSPHLYPPSRRNSLSPDVSETRPSSALSTFSLSLHSARSIDHSRVVPVGASEDNLSQHLERGYRAEENEEPPPPYPGNVILIASLSTRSMDYICHAHLSSADENSRISDSEASGGNTPSASNERTLVNNTGESHGSHVVNAWTDNEAESPASHTESQASDTESNEASRTRSCQSNRQGRNSAIDQRNTNVSTCRTLVSHSLEGAKEVVSTSHALPSENV